MSGSSSPLRSEAPLSQAEDRLDSWKEIAAYLKRDIRTVQRWEKQESLPVHRHMHGEQGSVYAYKAEIDAWRNNGRHRFGPPDSAADVTATTQLDANGDRPNEYELRELAPTFENGGPSADQLQSPSAVVDRRYSTRWSWVVAVAGVVILAAIIGYLSRPVHLPRVTGYTQLTSDGRQKAPFLLTDGLRLYFVEETPEHTLSLVSVSMAGGDPTPMATPFREFALLDLSRRRSELLITTPEPGGQGNALWTLPIAGGTPHRVGDLIVKQAAWPPDGEKIAYTRGRDLFLARSDGTDSRKLVTLPGDIAGLSWSPDGRLLRLSVWTPGQPGSAFWDVATDGSVRQRVVLHVREGARGSWSPDGSYFVFFAGSISPERARLWASRARRSFFQRTPGEPVELAATAPIDFDAPALCLDDKKIFAVGIHRRPELARYDARLKEFVPYLGGIAATWASFSRIAKWVAYLTLPQRALWRAKADGSQPVQLTFAPLEGDGLAWSPDGKQIALRARMPGKPWKIYLVPAESGAAVPLTAGDKDEGIPTWSGDGKKIVFGDVPALFGHDDGSYALHVVEVETQQASELPGSKGLWTARWSPDGRFVAALTIAPIPKLRLFDFATRRWQELADSGVNNLAWAHDSRYLYFDSVPPSAIYRVRISDGKVERIADLGGTGRAIEWGCGLAPDDSPLITREVGFSEIYALDWEP